MCVHAGESETEVARASGARGDSDVRGHLEGTSNCILAAHCWRLASLAIAARLRATELSYCACAHRRRKNGMRETRSELPRP